MIADRIFLDANILFSIAYGSPGLTRLWELAQKKHCELFASNYVVEEAKRNLLSSEQLRKLEAFLSMVQLAPDVDPSIPCPIELPEKDRPVLLAAISIKANYLLTGDMIHFGKYFGQTVRGIKICLPRDYLLVAQQRKTKR
ncbi:MAG TPA: PIN domain-containing protein [Thermodesulfobacteriota bacterium]|nr:PIN domain-containing protein [Thermodesulfobacteriota bacterium]